MTTDNDLLRQLKLISETMVETTNGNAEEVRTAHLVDDKMVKNEFIIQDVINYYEALSDFRERAERAYKYHRGEQWSDTVEDDDGNMVSEESIITGRGKLPLKNNMIGQIVKNLAGQFLQGQGKTNIVSTKREQQKDAEVLTQALRAAYRLNRMKILDMNTIIEGMISGIFVQKSVYKYYPERDKEDLFVTKPVFSRMFFNSDITDGRMNEIRMIGELHDLTIDNIIMLFARNEADAQIIKSWYSDVTKDEVILASQGLKEAEQINVRMPNESHKGRVIEVWQKKLVRRMREHDTAKGSLKMTKRSIDEIAVENYNRVKLGKENGIPRERVPLIKAQESYEQVWTVKYLTPLGHTLYEGETPYNHQSHPYTMVFAQFVNGRAWGIVEDIIDQQRYINRLISLLDFMMGTAAKGVLLVPEDSIPDDMTLDDIADEWSKFDGVVKFKAKAGVPIPQQISGNVTNIGANEQLAIQFDLIEKISGVTGAIQGHDANSGTPSSLYAQQTLNASTNSKILFEAFNDFREQRDQKALKIITQFYNEKRYIDITGTDFGTEAMVYDPEKIKSMEYFISIAQGMDTPAYRMLMDEQLKMLLEGGAIDAEIYLQNSSHPFSDKILESIKNKKEEASEMQQQAAQANPNQVQQVQQMMGVNK